MLWFAKQASMNIRRRAESWPHVRRVSVDAGCRRSSCV